MNNVFQRASVALCAAGLPILAIAQDAQPQLEEVLVTAQKRAENVQDVPLAIAVVTGDQLVKANVNGFADMSRISPSLNIRSADQPVNASVALRGIGTFAFSIGVEPSVAVQIDDVPVAFQARAFTDLTDVERIEVLRGPQSTLYGKSASAGLINITTKAPTDQFTSTVSLAATTDEEYRGSASIAGPLGEKLSYRLTGSHSDFKGNVDNLTTGRTVNGNADSTARGKLVWDPIEPLKVTLGLSYSRGESTATGSWKSLSPTTLLRGQAGLTPGVVLPDIVASSDNLAIEQNVDPRARSHGFGQSLKVEYDLPGDFSIASISSHDRYRLDDQLDVDRTNYAPLDNRQGGTFRAGVKTQELRLLSPSDQPLTYTVGLYYGDNDLTRRFQRGPRFSLANWYATSGSTQKAIFTQGDWRFLPKTIATAGVRFQDEEIEYTFQDIQNNASFAGSASDSATTYRVGVRQELTDDLMAFVSYATGHKGQTYDLTTGFNVSRANAGPVSPEESKAYELGLKSQLFERRLTLNANVFHVIYDDFQQQGIETIGGVQNFRLTNVGTVKTKGVEVEASWRATNALRINGAAAYTDALIDSFPAANCFPGQSAAQGCVGTPARQDLGGKRLPSAPKWKLNAGVDYDHSLGSSPFEATYGATYVYTSEQNFSLNQDPLTIQGGYGLLNLSAGIHHPDQSYSVTLFLNNVFDKGYAVNGDNQFSNFGSSLAVLFQPPRDFERYGGIRFTKEF
jgi:iron complex outermembrane receptor protein